MVIIFGLPIRGFGVGGLSHSYDISIGSAIVTFGQKTTTEGQALFIRVPEGSSIGGGPIYINPASTSAGGTLLGLAVNGVEKFRFVEVAQIT